MDNLKYNLNVRSITSGILGIAYIRDEIEIRYVIENAGPGNVVRVEGRLIGQADWVFLSDITGTDSQVVDVSTYEEVRVSLITYDSSSNYVDVIGSSFSNVKQGGGTSISTPSGQVTDADEVTFTSSDGSVIITGNDGTDTIDFTVVSGVTYSDEKAQDAVGSILVDSATIDFTYNDGTPSITAIVIQAGIDHGLISGNADDDHLQYHTDARALTWLGTRSTSDLPEGTNLYFTGAAAQAATISQVITNGVTTKAPSEDAVFDALALKADQSSLDAHINDTTAAHAASAISNVPAGTISSTDVQAAINELSGDDAAVQAFSIQRANHTGTQTASTISDFNAAASAAAPVQSVNTQTGAVVLTTANITEVTNLYFTDERAQDAVGTILTDSNTIDFTYNDGAPGIVADVRTQMSVTSDASGVKLSGDATSPGNTQYYGTNGAGTKGFFSIPNQGSTGDIQETSFSLTNNQVTPADVTGFLFAPGVVRGFEALVTVTIDATTDLFEVFELNGINKAVTFDMSVESTGDTSGVVFSITSGGQVQYTSSNYSGFSTGIVKFRSDTLSV